MRSDENREAWLHRAAKLLRPLLSAAGADFPEDVRLAVGFPSRNALGSASRRVGECWHGGTSDSRIHIFISPVLGTSLEVLETLSHELIHAAHPKAKHRGAFVTVARSLGFTAPWTSTPATPELVRKLEAIASELGAYPSGSIVPTKRITKQSTRMKKVECVEGCGYVVRTTAKWLETLGPPVCPGCRKSMTVSDR